MRLDHRLAIDMEDKQTSDLRKEKGRKSIVEMCGRMGTYSKVVQALLSFHQVWGCAIRSLHYKMFPNRSMGSFLCWVNRFSCQPGLSL
jgi:hypothetical protein